MSLSRARMKALNAVCASFSQSRRVLSLSLRSRSARRCLMAACFSALPRTETARERAQSIEQTCAMGRRGSKGARQTLHFFMHQLHTSSIRHAAAATRGSCPFPMARFLSIRSPIPSGFPKNPGLHTACRWAFHATCFGCRQPPERYRPIGSNRGTASATIQHLSRQWSAPTSSGPKHSPSSIKPHRGQVSEEPSKPSMSEHC